MKNIMESGRLRSASIIIPFPRDSESATAVLTETVVLPSFSIGLVTRIVFGGFAAADSKMTPIDRNASAKAVASLVPPIMIVEESSYFSWNGMSPRVGAYTCFSMSLHPLLCCRNIPTESARPIPPASPIRIENRIFLVLSGLNGA